MDLVEKAVRLYMEQSGECPFEQWFDSLGDERTQERVLARIARLRLGSPGDWKALGEGLFEMRIHSGPGYRIYYGFDGQRIVILLAGGEKKTQPKDIKRAKEYWDDYQTSKKARNL